MNLHRLFAVKKMPVFGRSFFATPGQPRLSYCPGSGHHDVLLFHVTVLWVPTIGPRRKRYSLHGDIL